MWILGLKGLNWCSSQISLKITTSCAIIHWPLQFFSEHFLCVSCLSRETLYSKAKWQRKASVSKCLQEKYIFFSNKGLQWHIFIALNSNSYIRFLWSKSIKNTINNSCMVSISLKMHGVMKTKFRAPNVILTQVVNVCYTYLGNKPLYICIRESIL